ncbi:MAG: sigma-70 family RNA polymerase sigma factor [Burkholderiales bacterium]|nr:sigma-70 family RNA polymerase sigma factor [Anaerolineae bacterium]
MESDVIRRARQHDETAWETLVAQHQEAVFRLAYLLLGSAADADDVAQEAFVRAFRFLDGFDTERPLRPWLLRITANLARNRRRSVGRYMAHLRRLVWAEPERVIDPEGQTARNADSQALWEAVRRLDTNDQEVIYLRYFMELSVEETADVLKIASGTVKSRLHRALNRLRAVVEQDFPILQRESALND